MGPFFVPCYLTIDDAGQVVGAAPFADYFQHARVSDAGTLLSWDERTPLLSDVWERAHPSLEQH